MSGENCFLDQLSFSHNPTRLKEEGSSLGHFKGTNIIHKGFPGSARVNNLSVGVGDTGSILGSGRSPGEGNGFALQYCCLNNSMDRGAWWATVHRVAKSWT